MELIAVLVLILPWFLLAVGLLGCEMADLPAGLLCLLEIRDSRESEAQVFLR